MLVLPCCQGLLPVRIVVWPLVTLICGMVCSLFMGKKKKPNQTSANRAHFMDLASKGGLTGEAYGVLRRALLLCPAVGQSREFQDSGPHSTATLCKTSPDRIKCSK